MAMTPVPRYRATAGPAVLSQGFRPFFLLAALWAVVALGVWLFSFWGHLEVPTAFDPTVQSTTRRALGSSGSASHGP